MQQVFHDGSLSLHTRSLKYGKVSAPKHTRVVSSQNISSLSLVTAFVPQLLQGTLVCVPPVLVKRCKNHFHNLLCGASVILGNNGYIWICPHETTDHLLAQRRFQELPSSAGSQDTHSTSREEREVIARLRNCIKALAQNQVMIYDTTLQYTYEASLKFQVERGKHSYMGNQT